MANRRITLVFPPDRIQKPVVFNMAKACDVVPNIRRARVTESIGEMTLELEGEEENIQKAIEYLKSNDVDVQFADGQSVT